MDAAWCGVEWGSALDQTGRPSRRPQLGIVLGVPRASAAPGSRSDVEIRFPTFDEEREFFSGEDAGYLTVAAAGACHSAFDAHYRQSRRLFSSILRDIGLGIGIDYGPCHLVRVAGTLTIVGAPVVYACRLGGAPARTTLLNQPAYEAIDRDHGARVDLVETEINIKHEGSLVAYSATLKPHTYVPRLAPWKVTRTAVDQAASAPVK